jgi:hypothetical protein
VSDTATGVGPDIDPDTTRIAIPDEVKDPAARPRRVVYLLGAGATQGCVKHSGSSEELLMRGDFQQRLFDGMNELYSTSYASNAALGRLVNDVVDEHTDFEQLITFLGDARSSEHRNFALGLRQVFFDVLSQALESVEAELGDARSTLLAALIDMHEVSDSGEILQGFLTLNYDALLEHAIVAGHGRSVDYGVKIVPGVAGGVPAIRVLKLHGSFDWTDKWPVGMGATSSDSTWIPPGIKKVKTEYPFNALWGMAQEMLDCDVLRIVGCNLGPNDWDLVSLLFATRHAHADATSYEVEIISWPSDAQQIAERCPYLDVTSLLRLPDVGEMIVAEALGDPKKFDDLESDEQQRALAHASSEGNPFAYWLRIKGEVMNRDLPSISTPRSFFEEFLAS